MPERLTDAADYVTQCANEFAEAKAKRALDEEAFDDALIVLRESLESLARQAGPHLHRARRRRRLAPRGRPVQVMAADGPSLTIGLAAEVTRARLHARPGLEDDLRRLAVELPDEHPASPWRHRGRARRPADPPRRPSAAGRTRQTATSSGTRTCRR